MYKTDKKLDFVRLAKQQFTDQREAKGRANAGEWYRGCTASLRGTLSWSCMRTQTLVLILLAMSSSPSSAAAMEGKDAMMEGAAHMDILRIVPAGITHPFGDHRTVDQAFPAAIPSSESDPFLMCDSYDFPSGGVESDPDSFPVGWHPHRGFAILSYLKSGIGRHGDSMGNRETFRTPGMQWINVGSGIEHAEGGATPKGMRQQGFQIWVNVPSARKMDDPEYGTEPPEAIPQVEVSKGANVRLLAGELHLPVGAEAGAQAGAQAGTEAGTQAATRVGSNSYNSSRRLVGPFRTKVDVQMIDVELDPGSHLVHTLPPGYDTAMVYVYDGGDGRGGTIGGRAISGRAVALLDASDDGKRTFTLGAAALKGDGEVDHGSGKVEGEAADGAEGEAMGMKNKKKSSKKFAAMIFAGRKLKEPVAWHGPIVMNTDAELQEAFAELNSGRFPPVRVPWDYKRAASFPKVAGGMAARTGAHVEL